MAIAPRRPPTPLSVRPYEAGDERTVLDLVNADRIPGQPETTRAMLAEALVGNSPVDGDWWAELDVPVTEVVHDGHGRVLGVVSYSTRPRDGAGFLLWLHSVGKGRALTDALIARALDRLGPRTVHAFEFASALSLGLEGLPVRNRPEVRRALGEAGFVPRDLWRYMHARLPLTGLPHAANVTVSDYDGEGPPGKRLEINEDDEPSAEAVIRGPVAGVGVLSWISVTPTARGRGLGSALLGSALHLLADLGADQVILYVDDDAPPGDAERDRTAANRMYGRAGLTEIDRLFSFTRHPEKPGS